MRLQNSKHPAGSQQTYESTEGVFIHYFIVSPQELPLISVMLRAGHVPLDMANSSQKTLSCHLPGSACHLSIKATYKYFHVLSNSHTGGSHYACGHQKPPDPFHVSCRQLGAL